MTMETKLPLQDFIDKTRFFIEETTNLLAALMRPDYKKRGLGEDFSHTLHGLCDETRSGMDSLLRKEVGLSDAYTDAIRRHGGLGNMAAIEADESVRKAYLNTAAQILRLNETIQKVHSEFVGKELEKPELLAPLLEQIDNLTASHRELIAEALEAGKTREARRGFPLPFKGRSQQKSLYAAETALNRAERIMVERIDADSERQKGL